LISRSNSASVVIISANTPNWDLVSGCQIGNRQGLILVEAKAHEGELADDATPDNMSVT
jgi:hypothetical protein